MDTSSEDIALATGHYPLHGRNETLIYGTFVLMHTNIQRK